MRAPHKHDAISLDDIRDFRFIILDQNKLQGSYRRWLDFAHTAGGTCKYTLWLWNVPIFVTVNKDTCIFRGIWGEAVTYAPPRGGVLGWSPEGPTNTDSRQNILAVTGVPASRATRGHSYSTPITRMVAAAHAHRGMEAPAEKFGWWSPKIGS